MRILLRRCLWAIVPLCALLLLVRLDAMMKAASFPGFCPRGASMALASDNFPAFYAALDSCDFWKAGSEEIRAPLNELPQQIRLQTGIRPTPLRWRVWLGGKFLAARSSEGTGICVCPGLLLRFAELCRRGLHRTGEEDGVCRYGGLFYGWRERFLIVSTARDYVKASLSDSAPDIEPAREAAELRIVHPGVQGVLRVHARNAMPFDGWLPGTVTGRQAPLTLAASWPRAPMLSMCASRVGDLKILANAVRVAAHYAASRFLDEDLQKYVDGAAARFAGYAAGQLEDARLPAGWDSSLNECAVALWDIDTEETIPVPELALVLRGNGPALGPHPFEKILPVENAVSHEWNGRPGLVVPWMGEKLAVCLGSRDRDWMLATQEPIMAELAASRVPDATADADAVVTLDWGRAAHRAEKLLQEMADMGMIPGMNREDVERGWMQYVRAVARLGKGRLEAHSRDGRIEFAGVLAEQNAGGKAE